MFWIRSGLNYKVSGTGDIISSLTQLVLFVATGASAYSDTLTRKVTRPMNLSRSSLLRKFEPSTLHSTVCSTLKSSLASSSCTATIGCTYLACKHEVRKRSRCSGVRRGAAGDSMIKCVKQNVMVQAKEETLCINSHVHEPSCRSRGKTSCPDEPPLGNTASVTGCLSSRETVRR